MRGHRLLLVLVLVLTVSLAGCPGDGGDSGYARSEEPGGLGEGLPVAGGPASPTSASTSPIGPQPAEESP